MFYHECFADGWNEIMGGTPCVTYCSPPKPSDKFEMWTERGRKSAIFFKKTGVIVGKGDWEQDDRTRITPLS